MLTNDNRHHTRITMPREDRRIIFDLNEIYKALYTLTEKQEGVARLLPGVILRFEEDAADKNQIHFFIHNPQSGEEDERVTYSRDFVAAALMMFCRGAGVPLPKKANKSVLIRENELILRVMV